MGAWWYFASWIRMRIWIQESRSIEFLIFDDVSDENHQRWRFKSKILFMFSYRVVHFDGVSAILRVWKSNDLMPWQNATLPLRAIYISSKPNKTLTHIRHPNFLRSWNNSIDKFIRFFLWFGWNLICIRLALGRPINLYGWQIQLLWLYASFGWFGQQSSFSISRFILF